MKIYLAKRLLYMLFVLFAVSFLTFALTTAAPGGAAAAGLQTDAPYFLRYIAWLKMLLLGDTGDFFWPRRAVFFYFGEMIPGTLRLAGISLAVILFVSLPLGILSAIRKNGLFDYLIRFFSFFCVSVPNFSLGLFLLFFFAVKFRLFPVIGSGDLRSYVLPVCALSAPIISRFTRQIRGAVLEELSRDYVAGASARGLRPWRIIFFHVLPNAASPLFVWLGIAVGHIIGAIAVIETVFIWGGIGALTVSSIRSRDYLIIQAYILWMAVLYIFARMTIDTLACLLDPRLRRKGAA